MIRVARARVKPGGAVAERQQLAAQLRKQHNEGMSIRALAASSGRSYGFVQRLLTEPSTTRTSRRTGPAQRRGRAASPEWLPRERTAFLIDHLGGVNAVARWLGVSPSQPSRWRSGAERPGPEVARRLLDLDHVLARALLVWEVPVARDWLESPNAFLDGRVPVDVLLTAGPAEVVYALDATSVGAFA